MTAQKDDPTIDVNSPYTPRRPSPVISVSINHPIGTLLRKIKNFLTHRQTLFATSFTIKVTPIVALVSLFGLAALFGGGVTTAYNFGKTVQQRIMAALPSPTSASNAASPSVIANVSKSGTIKATYQNPPIPTVIPSQTDGSHSASKEPTPIPVLHYILVSRSGSINYLSASNTIDLQKYLNVRVLITGSFDSSKNTLTITKSSDIEVLQ
ncbi:MAG TPA: hypothetical protein VEW42_06530 [Candidatus Eisenbacteria bacterium]|nr:hypothetical protein [Candidatus Eisenbacteria bacterium]